MPHKSAGTVAITPLFSRQGMAWRFSGHPNKIGFLARCVFDAEEDRDGSILCRCAEFSKRDMRTGYRQAVRSADSRFQFIASLDLVGQ